MKVVLDTNVLISAVLKPGGLEAAVVEAVLAGHLEAWVTPEVWAEYEEVFSRPKFAKIREASRKLLDALSARAQWTTSIAPSTLALDEDDNRFVECAQAAQANYLVTGNLKDYPDERGPTRAVNARELLSAL